MFILALRGLPFGAAYYRGNKTCPIGSCRVANVFGFEEGSHNVGLLLQARQTQGPRARVEPPNTRPPLGDDRRRAESYPAWLESVLRHQRSAGPSARDGQVDSATVTLLRMEAMGIEGLPRIATVRRIRARSMERQQEHAWPVANLEDPGTVVGDANDSAGYVTRTHGGVGGGPRGSFLSRLGSTTMASELPYDIASSISPYECSDEASHFNAAEPT
jgi:hypothetical protein